MYLLSLRKLNFYVFCEFLIIFICFLFFDFLVFVLVLVVGCFFFSYGVFYLDIWSFFFDIGLEEIIDWFDWLDSVVFFLVIDFFFFGIAVLEAGLDIEDWKEGIGIVFFWGLIIFGFVKYVVNFVYKFFYCKVIYM